MTNKDNTKESQKTKKKKKKGVKNKGKAKESQKKKKKEKGIRSDGHGNPGVPLGGLDEDSPQQEMTIVTPTAVMIENVNDTFGETSSKIPLAQAVAAPSPEDTTTTTNNDNQSSKFTLTSTGVILYAGVCFFLAAVVVTSIVVCANGLCTPNRRNNDVEGDDVDFWDPPQVPITSAPIENWGSETTNTKPPPPLCTDLTTCYRTMEDVMAALLSDENSVVALCGDISLPEDTPLVVERYGVILMGCCGSNNGNKCTITRSGVGKNLIVTGGNFSMHNIILQNGKEGSFPPALYNTKVRPETCGANLLINNKVSTTYFTITDCEFLNGRCEVAGAEGGNVYIETGGGVFLFRSKFSNGVATFGGGLSIADAAHVVLEDCEVTENRGSGMSHFVWDSSFMSPGQNIQIRKSVFAYNQGSWGGAIFGSNFGTMAKLNVWNTQFEFNTCTDTCGGTACIIGSTGSVELTWENNSVTGDSSPNGSCDEVYFAGRDGQFCFAASDSFQLPIQ